MKSKTLPALFILFFSISAHGGHTCSIEITKSKDLLFKTSVDTAVDGTESIDITTSSNLLSLRQSKRITEAELTFLDGLKFTTTNNRNESNFRLFSEQSNFGAISRKFKYRIKKNFELSSSLNALVNCGIVGSPNTVLKANTMSLQTFTPTPNATRLKPFLPVMTNVVPALVPRINAVSNTKRTQNGEHLSSKPIQALVSSPGAVAPAIAALIPSTALIPSIVQKSTPVTLAKVSRKRKPKSALPKAMSTTKPLFNPLPSLFEGNHDLPGFDLDLPKIEMATSDYHIDLPSIDSDPSDVDWINNLPNDENSPKKRPRFQLSSTSTIPSSTIPSSSASSIKFCFTNTDTAASTNPTAGSSLSDLTNFILLNTDI